MCGFSCKKKERKVLNSSLYSLTHRNARILKLVSLRVRRIWVSLFLVRETGLEGLENSQIP